ncbi:MAG: hypothetical protein ACRD0O_04410 [Acidimicrobiia bacterium]
MEVGDGGLLAGLAGVDGADLDPHGLDAIARYVDQLEVLLPAGDAGDLEIRRGDAVILRVNLSNFRDLDYHFVSPLSFKAGQELVMAVSCANPAEGPRCTPAAYFAGFTEETPAG